MADKKPNKRKKKGSPDEESNLTKDETAVAKYLRFNLATKKGTMYGDEVFYFSGSKAINVLLDSKWASKSKTSVSFTHRESVSVFMSRLLSCGLFTHIHVIKTEKKVKDKKKDGGDKKKERKTKSGDEKEQKEEKKVPGSPVPKKDKDGREAKKVKKKVKITLEPHEQQAFFDGDDEFYVWIFDPVSWKTFVLGILLVIAIIAVCLFPLWPESIREYSWYLSVAGAIFVGAILVLAVLRYIIYGLLWSCTLGKLHFWLLPNLTAECGFLESFVPIYEYEVAKPKENSEESETETQKQKESSTVASDEKPESKLNVKNELEKENIVEGDNKKESDESSGSAKDEDWVKVQKGDVDENNTDSVEVKC